MENIFKFRSSAYLLILFLLLMTGCSPYKKEILKDRKRWQYNTWKKDFKERAFCMCLVNGYEDNKLKNDILRIDLSYYSATGYSIFDPVLEPVLKQEIIRMKRDSLESIGSVAEHAVGKRIFNHCLSFYKSKRLAALANRESKKWRRIKSISEIIEREMPSY